MRVKAIARIKASKDSLKQFELAISKDHAFLLKVAKYLDKHLHRFKKLIQRAEKALVPNENSPEEVANEYGAAWDALKDSILENVIGEELAEELLKMK